MHVDSVNVGLPREVVWQGRVVNTGIFKNPVAGPVPIVGTTFAGDGQADLRHHGGQDKAVYAYASEHYPFWENSLNTKELTPGNFGENLSTTGLLESDVRPGDQFRVGTAVLMVMQPRFPCAKLGLRFGDARMVKRFAQARRSGIYFRVLQAGVVQAGDALERLETSPLSVTIQDVVDNFYTAREERDAAKIEELLRFPLLPPFLREAFVAA